MKIITLADLEAGGADQSREVSADEFAAVWRDGERTVQALYDDGYPSDGLNGDTFEQVAYNAYVATREAWGGITVDALDGTVLTPDQGYAVTVRRAGTLRASVDPTAPYAEFRRGLEKAVAAYWRELGLNGACLGIFYDVESYRIDIDPVVIMPSQESAEAVGAYTFAVGGAYDFSTGNGVWPPHVAG